LDTFTQTLLDEIFYKDEEYSKLWLEYAEMCNDEVKVYNYMLTRGIYTNLYYLIERILNYHCSIEDFVCARHSVSHSCNNYKDGGKKKIYFYEKLKSAIEMQLSTIISSSIIFPEVINRFLKKKLGDFNYKSNENYKNLKNGNFLNNFNNMSQLSEDKENINTTNINLNIKNTIFPMEIQSSTSEKTYLKELKQEIDFLIKKFTLCKEFLMKYDEQFKLIEEHKTTPQKLRPESWLNDLRLKPRLSVNLIKNVLTYMHISDYYTNSIQSHQSALLHYTLKKTEFLPRLCKIEFSADLMEKDCVEYMHKINILLFTKYDRENYSTKISLMKFVNNNFHIRTMTINYAVKNTVYLHGINENYIGLFTPFYFIVLDTKSLIFVFRYRFETHHYSEENAVNYLIHYNEKTVAFSIMNIIYIVEIILSQNIIVKFKLEGHKDEINILSYKSVEKLNILLSSSKTQIVLWDLDTQNVLKMFSIDESKLVIKGLVLLNLKVLCITTVYNQLYVLEFADSNLIHKIRITNFNEEESIFDFLPDPEDEKNYDKNLVAETEDYIFKLNNSGLSLYDPVRDKVLVNYFQTEQNFKNSDLIFVHKNKIIKKIVKKSKVAVYKLS
jgi:WD40 repeat protein